MLHSLTHRNAELNTAISSRRDSVLLSIKVMLSATAFMALFEFGKSLLIPSITLWRSHLITIVAGGVIATVVSHFVFDKIHAAAESFRKLVEQSPDAVMVHRQGKILFVNMACVSLHEKLPQRR